VKTIKIILTIYIFLFIFSSVSPGETNFPVIYINGKVFQGRILLYNNILYAECDALMNATGAKHIYNITQDIHYINGSLYPNENVYVYENRFYFYIKTAVLAAGATRAVYDKATNTITIEIPASYAGETVQSPPVSSDFMDFDSAKEGETGFTEHYDLNQELDVLLKDVSACLYSKYGMQVPAAVQVIAVSREELEYVARKENLIDGSKLAGLYWRNKIYIQYDLSVGQMYEVMAHEYSHAWQNYNCPADQEELLVEGFAEWIAYKYTQERSHVATFSPKGDNVYGKGLRFFLELEAKAGETGVFDYVKKNRNVTE